MQGRSDPQAGAAVPNPEPTRRDVLRVATGVAGGAAVVGAVATAAYMVPLLDEPDVSAPPPAGSVDVDLLPLQAGQQIMVFWRSWPVFVVHRTAQAVTMLRDPDLLGQLADPDSEQLQQPPYARNRQRSVRPEFAVLVGICTHMGCTPQFYPQPHASEPQPDWLGGYLCPCHGSKYDLAGRVFKDFPAPYNLPVPPHRFVSDKIIRIGENPSGAKFDFNTILQI
ncbi:MAG TPA: ubiquinol-cytochrome c reductase iron-sulfur subunit [Xanthobacteraceae bacterium]|jgi:ubiquinol-cytochrome c reductase iron-sulfur subunit